MMMNVVATVGVTAAARTIVGMTGRMTKIIIGGMVIGVITGIRGSATRTTTTTVRNRRRPRFAWFRPEATLFVPGIAHGCRRRSAIEPFPE